MPIAFGVFQRCIAAGFPKFLEELTECFSTLDLRHMARVGKQVSLRARQVCAGRIEVDGGQDEVTITPDDERRYVQFGEGTQQRFAPLWPDTANRAQGASGLEISPRGMWLL